MSDCIGRTGRQRIVLNFVVYDLQSEFLHFFCFK